MGRVTLAAALDLWPDLMITFPWYSLFWITRSLGCLRCKNSIKMCIMMTIIMLNMKKRSQMSANFNTEDFGSELIKEDKREANTKNPVMAPMNLLLKSLMSINKVK